MVYFLAFNLANDQALRVRTDYGFTIANCTYVINSTIRQWTIDGCHTIRFIGEVLQHNVGHGIQIYTGSMVSLQGEKRVSYEYQLEHKLQQIIFAKNHLTSVQSMKKLS